MCSFTDDKGVYAINMQYAAECGYSLSILPSPGHTELRASYFSCHADNHVRTLTPNISVYPGMNLYFTGFHFIG